MKAGGGGGKQKKIGKGGGRGEEEDVEARVLTLGSEIFSESPRVPLSRRPVLGGLQGGRRRVARGQKESPTSHLATPPRHSQSWNLEVWAQISRTGRGRRAGTRLGWLPYATLAYFLPFLEPAAGLEKRGVGAWPYLWSCPPPPPPPRSPWNAVISMSPL